MNYELDIISIRSSHTVTETINKLQEAFKAKGITIYGRIDQKAEATKVGLDLRPMELLIFGNPKAGIPLMKTEPLVGIDLPLKLLGWESEDQKVWVSFNSAGYLQHRFSLPEELMKPIAVIEGMIRIILQG
jgi:uncharacterized protein (DUF302 family)